MAIPGLNDKGFLPQRVRLFGRLEELIRAMQLSGLFETLLVDGSIVTAKPAPNDIDLVAVLRAGHDFERGGSCDSDSVLMS
jgi:hypothetical protein